MCANHKPKRTIWKYDGHPIYDTSGCHAARVSPASQRSRLNAGRGATGAGAAGGPTAAAAVAAGRDSAAEREWVRGVLVAAETTGIADEDAARIVDYQAGATTRGREGGRDGRMDEGRKGDLSRYWYGSLSTMTSKRESKRGKGREPGAALSL
jgi:hypothetical protein